MPGARAALRIDLEELGRHVSNALCRTRPSLLPLAAAELVERRVLALGAGVAGDQMEREDGHIELITIGVFDAQVFAPGAAGIE